MNYAEQIKQKLQRGSTEPLKAVVYARVSTDNEGQKDSCSNQVAMAESFVRSHPNIELLSIFVDDGISGKNDFTRPQYNAMVDLLQTEGFDLIITKALSRLNRDELNSLLLNSMLIEHNATVYTLEDGQVHDFEDINSGLLHSLKYAIDAQYVKQQSINGRKTQELRIQKKELSAKDISFGYDWHRDTKTITINEDQAEIVKWMFDEYVYRNCVPSDIQEQLKSKKGMYLSLRTIRNIIHDERYIGNFYINKRTSKLGTGKSKSKRIPLPKEQWVLCERPDLQIVDEDVFKMAQRVHNNRITVYEKPDKEVTKAYFQGTHLYASKVFCPVCGQPYQYGFSDRAKQIPLYMIKNHSECTNPVRRIKEEDLKEITQMTLRKMTENQDDLFDSLEKTLSDVVKTYKVDRSGVEKFKKQKAAKEKQLDNLIDQLSEGDLTDQAKSRIKSKINAISSELDGLDKEIEKVSSAKMDGSYVNDKMNQIRRALLELRKFDVIDRQKILNYIDHISMPADGNVQIYLKTGDMTGFGASNDLRVCTGGIQDAPC